MNCMNQVFYYPFVEYYLDAGRAVTHPALACPQSYAAAADCASANLTAATSTAAAGSAWLLVTGTCGNCGGELKILAAILVQPVIE